MKYYLIAGEASGDLHASHLMHALKTCDTQAEFRFFGGEMMEAEGGVPPVRHYREMAFMGFLPVLLNLNKVLNNLALCKSDIANYRPDVVILIDYPGFNLKIAQYVKEKLHLPVHYYISPKIWAWKEYRIKRIKRYIDRMYCILPFEVDFYRKHQYEVTYVGNPTADEIAHRSHQAERFEEFNAEYHLDARPKIALLAGSRRTEIARNLPLMIEAVAPLTGYQAVIAAAPGIDDDFYREVLQGQPVPFVRQATYRLLQQSRAALVTSGTATLETALLRIPQVVCYSVSGGRLFFLIFKRILNVKYVSLVNLIANRWVVAELLSYHFTPQSARQVLIPLLTETHTRNTMLADYQEVAQRLNKPHAATHAAEEIYCSLKQK